VIAMQPIQRTYAWSIALLAILACLAAPGAVLASGSVAWTVRGDAQPTEFQPAGLHRYQLLVMNTGSAPSAPGLTLIDRLPAGLTMVSFENRPGFGLGGEWACAEAEPSLVSCTLTEEVVPAGDYAQPLEIEVSPPSESPAPLENRVTVSGGGATIAASTSESTLVGKTPQTFALADFSVEVGNADGSPSLQAGGHPWQVTASFGFPWREVVFGEDDLEQHYAQVGNVKKLSVELPAGLVGNLLSTSQHCTETHLNTTTCPAGSVVGSVALAESASEFGSYMTPETLAGPSPIYNVTPESGYPAQLAFVLAGQPIYIDATVLHTAGGERVRLAAVSIPPVVESGNIVVTLWGQPGAFNGTGTTGALITNPTACTDTPLTARAEAQSWGDPTHPVFAETTVYRRISGCDALQAAFSPSLSLTPLLGQEGTTQADAPSGYTGALEVPQGADVIEEPQTAEVREATVALAPGMSVNPPAAQGLVGCQERGPEGINLGTSEIGNGGRDEGNPEATELGAGHGGGDSSPYDDGLYHTAPGHCPKASIVGSVEVFSPLVKASCGEVGEAACEEGQSPAPLQGHVFLAQPKCGGSGQHECTGADAEDGNLLAAYVEVSGDGILIKQPATLSANQATGQLTLHVRELPQLPFSELRVRVHGGPRAPLANPQSCGPQTTSSLFTPWSGTAPASPLTSFNVDWDGDGGACPVTLPFAPSFNAGTVSSAAGVYSPLTLTLARQDREQDLADLEETLPAGLLAKLAGVAQCPDAQAAAGSCPAASQIGTVTVAAGAGPDPLYVTGRIYLNGPYKGGPFGETVVVPAVAGPFNLGNVIVRGSIRVDPSTAQATVVSDPFPTILDGIPLRVKTVNVTLDRPGFTFNPTNCSQQQLTGTVTALQGASVNVSSPFAVVNCANLPFKPAFSASVGGHASKLDGASLDVRIAAKGGPQPGGGEANFAKVKVSLPKVLPPRLGTLQKACTQAQFQANPAGCPQESDIGTATASTPVLANPLSGPAYLVSHGGAAFPDLEMVLQGEGITVILDGQTDIKDDIITSTFNSVPDVPVASFELKLHAGPYSLLTADASADNPYQLCGQTLSMPTTITGQNGTVIAETTKIATSGCAKAAVPNRAQKLAKALKACRGNAKKSKRVACERRARKSYGRVAKRTAGTKLRR
jgi:uncharacterized repeat protein (TIGR01451 family)